MNPSSGMEAGENYGPTKVKPNIPARPMVIIVEEEGFAGFATRVLTLTRILESWAAGSVEPLKWPLQGVIDSLGISWRSPERTGAGLGA